MCSLFVSLDNFLHKTVAHNILLSKIALCNPIYIFKHVQCIHKTAAGAFRQIDLGHITGNHHLGADTHTCEEHFHLLRCGVLCLVQNDKGIIQRASAHIGKRCNLNDLLFHKALVSFGTQHIKQAVIQRAQIRVYLLLQITGQKAQLFTCFHCRAGEHDAGNILGFKSLYRHGNGQIGLAGTRRANAKGDGIGADGIEIFLLAQCFGPDRPSLDRYGNKIFGQFLDPIADKMLVTAGLLAFLKEGLCNIWIVFVIIIREFVMTSLRLIASSQGKVIPANIFGKIKTVMQMVSFIVVMLLCHVDDYFGWPISLMPADISNILMGLSAVMGVVSAVIYYVQSKDVIDFNK